MLYHIAKYLKLYNMVWVINFTSSESDCHQVSSSKIEVILARRYNGLSGWRQDVNYVNDSNFEPKVFKKTKIKLFF